MLQNDLEKTKQLLLEQQNKEDELKANTSESLESVIIPL